MPLFPSAVPVASTAAARVDTSKVGLGIDKYLYAQGLVKPSHRKLLAWQQPQYYHALTALLERMGRSQETPNQFFTWSEQGRTRQSAAVTAIGTTGSATITITTDVAATTTGGSDDGYFLVGDTILTETRVIALITSIANTGNVQVLTCSKADKTNWAAGDVATSERIGHQGSAFAEGTNHPGGRIFFPTEDYNYCQIQKRSAILTRNSLTNAYWVDGLMDAYYFKEDSVIQNELARDIENQLIFGVKSPKGATGPLFSEGIATKLLTNAGSVKTTYTGSVVEADIQNHIVKLKISSPADSFLVCAGAAYIADVQIALKGYFLNGAAFYGDFGKVDTVGLSISNYEFFGTKLSFLYLPIFNDVASLPFTGTSTSTKINFSKFSMWLNMGTDSNGEKLLTMRHTPGAELIYGYEPGMAGNGKGTFGGMVASSFDGMKIYIMAERGIELRLLNQHGVMYANG